MGCKVSAIDGSVTIVDSSASLIPPENLDEDDELWNWAAEANLDDIAAIQYIYIYKSV